MIRFVINSLPCRPWFRLNFLKKEWKHLYLTTNTHSNALWIFDKFNDLTMCRHTSMELWIFNECKQWNHWLLLKQIILNDMTINIEKMKYNYEFNLFHPWLNNICCNSRIISQLLRKIFFFLISFSNYIWNMSNWTCKIIPMENDLFYQDLGFQ